MPNISKEEELPLVRYVLIFLVDLNEAYAAEEISAVQTTLSHKFILIWILVVCGFFSVLLMILLIVALVAKKI